MSAHPCCAPTEAQEEIAHAAEREQRAFLCAFERSQGMQYVLHLALLLHQFIMAPHKPLTPHQERELDFSYQACEQENSLMPGICYIGHIFETGIAPIPQSYSRANFFFRRCASGNRCTLSKFFLATNTELGIGIPENPSQACAMYEEVVREAAFPEAILRLASLLDKGAKGVPRDSWRSVELYRHVIQKTRSTEAMDCLADIYAKGRFDVPKCTWRAINLYEKSLQECRASRAMVGLAQLFENGCEGVEKDMARAVSLYEEAIFIDGDTHALVSLGSILIEGYGNVQRDVRRAASLWESACAKGNPKAKRNLARLLETESEGIERDLKRAVALYEEIVDLEEFRCSRFNLAWILSCKEEGAPQDTKRAEQLYRQIVEEQGDINAMYNLACVLSDENDDSSVAKGLYERAMREGGHVPAMHSLGILLSSEKEGIQKDVKRAIELLESALEFGRKEAGFDLGIVLSSDDSGPFKDFGRAMQLYESAENELGHMGAIINASEILYEGKGCIERDTEKAKLLCERAIFQGTEGDTDVLEKLGICEEKMGRLHEDDESVRLRKHAISQGWHLLAMCNLAEMIILEGEQEKLGRAMNLFETATKSSAFANLCKVQGISFEGTLKGLRNMAKISGCRGEVVVRVVQVYEMLATRVRDSRAMRYLADIWMDGWAGMGSDIGRGVELYRHAAANGDKKAMLVIGQMAVCQYAGIGIGLNAALGMFCRVIAESSERCLRHEAAVGMAQILIAGHHS